MHRRSIVPTVLLTLALPAVFAGPVLAQSSGTTFTAQLSGGEEVPAVETAAGGAAEFVLDDDGNSLSFTVDVDGLEDTTMAHIHLAPAGENGPPVVWLHTQEQAPELVPGVFSGTLASGTITADDLVGPLEGATLDDLLAELAAGTAYVNVHTEEFPDGEV
ncbi:MAG TPA: CHRD domain-containing protein, partial [Egicoccus sp.]